jgi:hypothetical protein
MKTTILVCVLLLGILDSRAGNGGNDHISANKRSASVHNILSTQLPSRLLTSIRTRYKDYWITDLHKSVTEKKVSYYITLENPNQKVKLNTSHSASWQVAQVEPKLYY